jgi:hypothetical protein
LSTLFSDDFSAAATGGWDENSGENAAVGYVGGEYSMQLFQTSWYAWANPEGASLSLSNVRVEVTARNVGAASEPGFGIICNYVNAENFYYMGVSVDGYYVIVKTIGGQDTVLGGQTQWVPSDAIPVNAASYRLGAECGNGTLVLSVNGATVASATDTSLNSGSVGLFIQSFAESNVEIRFDDFEVTALQ